MTHRSSPKSKTQLDRQLNQLSICPEMLGPVITGKNAAYRTPQPLLRTKPSCSKQTSENSVAPTPQPHHHSRDPVWPPLNTVSKNDGWTPPGKDSTTWSSRFKDLQQRRPPSSPHQFVKAAMSGTFLEMFFSLCCMYLQRIAQISILAGPQRQPRFGQAQILEGGLAPKELGGRLARSDLNALPQSTLSSAFS